MNGYDARFLPDPEPYAYAQYGFVGYAHGVTVSDINAAIDIFKNGKFVEGDGFIWNDENNNHYNSSYVDITPASEHYQSNDFIISEDENDPRFEITTYAAPILEQNSYVDAIGANEYSPMYEINEFSFIDRRPEDYSHGMVVIDYPNNHSRVYTEVFDDEYQYEPLWQTLIKRLLASIFPSKIETKAHQSVLG